MNSPAPLDEAYRVYRPVLFSAMAWLARHGFPLPTTDGLDLIHDFFAEAWPGLSARYDPAKGDFRSYLFSAFVRFARPRIIRDSRWRSTLGPIDELGRAQVEPARFSDRQRAIVGDAFTRLDPDRRAVLEARIVRGESEREIARRLDVSRFRAREVCADALARLAVAIGEPGTALDRDWDLARALWAEDRPLADAAARVGLRPEQARVARLRMLKALAEGIATTARVSSIARRNQMPAQLCDIWKLLHADPSKRGLEAQLRPHLKELIAHVAGCQDCESVSLAVEDPAPVYAVLKLADAGLADDAAERSAEEATQQAIRELISKSDEAIDEAVRDVLLPALPRPLFDCLQRMQAEYGFPHRAVFLATDAISTLIHAIAQDDSALKSVAMLEGGALLKGRRELASAEQVREEMALVGRVTAEQAALLCPWVVSAARSHSRLFIGLRSEPGSRTDAVELRIEPYVEGCDLFTRWAVEVTAPIREKSRPVAVPTLSPLRAPSPQPAPAHAFRPVPSPDHAGRTHAPSGLRAPASRSAPRRSGRKA